MTQLKKLYSVRTLLREYMISDSAFIYKQQFDSSEKRGDTTPCPGHNLGVY
jgi:hypothetical protein